MSDLNLGQIYTSLVILLPLQALAFVVYLVVKNILTKNRFFRFLGIFSIGLVSSLIPLGPFSLVYGFPAVLIASILVSLFLDKEKKEK